MMKGVRVIINRCFHEQYWPQFSNVCTQHLGDLSLRTVVRCCIDMLKCSSPLTSSCRIYRKVILGQHFLCGAIFHNTSILYYGGGSKG